MKVVWIAAGLLTLPFMIQTNWIAGASTESAKLRSHFARSVSMFELNPLSIGEANPGVDPLTLQFSGYQWKVKVSHNRVGPGPNYFADGSKNVWVDARGRLHLRLTQEEGRWHCAKVISLRSFGYGSYRFYVDSTFDDLDPRVVLGLFTWSDLSSYSHREIDVEISRWGERDNKNGQFVIQPYTRPMNIVRFEVPSGLNASTHSFTWRPDSVVCESLRGSSGDARHPKRVIERHTFTEGIPQAGGENARMNLWLVQGRPPLDGKETEVIISRFEFVPLP